ncbi:hypothetical protein F5141DRAFT_1061304 [Pisolithus sp. B1]|nr:hypothetical protein F5141DRAFT_1061304 [Pisolithus sp. B1]
MSLPSQSKSTINLSTTKAKATCFWEIPQSRDKVSTRIIAATAAGTCWMMNIAISEKSDLSIPLHDFDLLYSSQLLLNTSMDIWGSTPTLEGRRVRSGAFPRLWMPSNDSTIGLGISAKQKLSNHLCRKYNGLETHAPITGSWQVHKYNLPFRIRFEQQEHTSKNTLVGHTATIRVLPFAVGMQTNENDQGTLRTVEVFSVESKYFSVVWDRHLQE